MPGERRYRAPREFGAWVGGRFYRPGSYLPLGTTHYRVTAIEEHQEVGDAFRTVSHVFRVGTSFADIEDEIGAIFEELWEENYYVFRGELKNR